MSQGNDPSATSSGNWPCSGSVARGSRSASPDGGDAGGGALTGLIGAGRSGGAGFGTSAALGTAAASLPGLGAKAALGLVAFGTTGACPDSSEDAAAAESRSVGCAETALFRSTGESDLLPRGSRGGRSFTSRKHRS